MESTAPHLQFTRILFSAKFQEVIVLSKEFSLQRWDVRDGARKLVQEQIFKEEIKIFPLDDDSFILLVVKAKRVEIWSWFLMEFLREFDLPEGGYGYVWDALYLPRHQFLLAGGGHNPYYFIDLQSGAVTPAFDKVEEPSDFADFLSCNETETMVVHCDTDQDHFFQIREIDWSRLRLRVIHRFDGTWRFHNDVLAWRPGADQLVDVAHNKVTCYSVNLEKCERNWELDHRVFEGGEELEQKRSGAQFFEDALYVASGQVLAQIVNGSVQRQWGLPAIVQDLAINPEGRIAYVAMKSGFIGIAI